MSYKARRLQAAMLSAALLLGACQNADQDRVVYSGNPIEVEPAPAPVQPDFSAIRRQRMLADMLYEASIAFEDNRLMTPAGSNAYDIYREVLMLDPGNAVAEQGLQDIAMRYIALADAETAKGQFDQADSLLGRAARLNPDRADLQAARERLAQARETKVEIHELDPAQLSQQDLEIMNRLADIAQGIMSQDATFLINARTDAEGRWIYKVMREAVGGYRLRGNIDISGTPNILVTLPRG